MTFNHRTSANAPTTLSASRSSTFRKLGGKRAKIITAKRTVSGEELK